MIRFLISAAFGGVALISERCLLEGSPYSDMKVNDVLWLSFEPRCLLEDMHCS